LAGIHSSRKSIGRDHVERGLTSSLLSGEDLGGKLSLDSYAGTGS
jgi:hypothetical protein